MSTRRLTVGATAGTTVTSVQAGLAFNHVGNVAHDVSYDKDGSGNPIQEQMSKNWTLVVRSDDVEAAKAVLKLYRLEVK